MSKIICDVCGTSYQETASHCPICGCARPVDVVPEIAFDETEIIKRENYTYVKGGRFSKTNVQKRLNGIPSANAAPSASSKKSSNSMNNKGDRGLVIAVCALLLAIIAVVIYIAVHFFSGSGNDNYKQPSVQDTTTQSIESDAPATDIDIPCTGIVLSHSEITFTSVGEVCALGAILTPDDTTDVLVFSTSDDAIVTVSSGGEVVAVAAGEAIITVTCGEASAQCRVVCSFVEDETEAATEPADDTREYTAPYKINKKDVSISVGETFQLKLTDANGEIIPVTWSPAVADICSINGNSITGSMKGKVEISTTYNGETYTCIVRVK